MKLPSTIILLFFITSPLLSQKKSTLTLAQCYEKAIDGNPIQDKVAFLQGLTRLQLEKIDIQKKPTLYWNASASVQSETVQFPFDLPNVDVPELPLYRFQTSLDAQYLLYDGGLREAQKQVEAANLNAEQFAVKVEAEQVKSQINQYFFGILLLEEKLKILEKNLESLESRKDFLEAGVKHGVVLESELKKLKVEILKLQAQIDQTKGEAQGLRHNLSYLIEQPIDDSTALLLPETGYFAIGTASNRSEFRLFELQKEKVLARESLITAAKKPKLSAFAQAGLGYPNPLNFFDDSLQPFGVLGAKFSWKITDWKDGEKDRQLLTVQSQLIDNQKEQFEYRLNQFDEKVRSDIQALELQIEKDQEIVGLQEEVTRQLAAQLDNGIINTTDYLIQVNAGIQAQLLLQTHLLQMEQIKVNYLTLKGLL